MVQLVGLEHGPGATGVRCLHVYERHKVWSLLLVAYFCGFVFALLSLLPLKFPHQVQRKWSGERVLFFSALMTEQQQPLIGTAVW